MRCRSKALKGWLGLKCCVLLIIMIFFLHRIGRQQSSNYRQVVQDSEHIEVFEGSGDRSAGDSHQHAQDSAKLHINAPKHSNNRPNTGGLIPKILHQVFSTEQVYSNYKPYLNSCLTLNPDWKYYLWTDAEAQKLIEDKYSYFMARFRKYTDNLEKADAIRYIILHHMGGIYLDMDVECVRPFFPALSGVQAFIDQERTEQTSIHFMKPYSAMNSAMGSVPGHPFFQHVIKALQGIRWVGDALRTTGPMVLTSAYESYSRQGGNPPVALLDPKIFSPFMSNDMSVWRRRCQFPLASAGKGSTGRNLSPQQRGCLTLQSKQWRSDDSDNTTIGVHRFLHLGYAWLGGRYRKALFNVTAAFPGRVKFYSSQRNASTKA